MDKENHYEDEKHRYSRTDLTCLNNPAPNLQSVFDRYHEKSLEEQNGNLEKKIQK
ncbi:MAG: hypothetical protein ACOYT4_02415 [Nanoarchaeota archaeon]